MEICRLVEADDGTVDAEPTNTIDPLTVDDVEKGSRLLLPSKFTENETLSGGILSV